jgi:hypothetical protein
MEELMISLYIQRPLNREQVLPATKAKAGSAQSGKGVGLEKEKKSRKEEEKKRASLSATGLASTDPIS